jgi:hypothetical protein
MTFRPDEAAIFDVSPGEATGAAIGAIIGTLEEEL